MPKATQGGASDVNVDPDYIAPAGVPPQDAIDQGLPDAGQPVDEPREADAAPDTGEVKRDKATKSVRSHTTSSDNK